MNTPSVFVGATAVACVFAFVVVQFTSPAPAAPPGTGTADALREQLDRAITVQEETARALQDLSARVSAVEAAGNRTERPTISEAEIDAALQRMIESKGMEVGAALADAAAKRSEKGKSGVSAESLFVELVQPGTTDAQWNALWARANEAGLTDELLTRFSAIVKERPNDADAHTGLGAALLQKMFTVTSDMEKGTWAMKADRAFEEALAINPNHWDARFAKAMSLSFWPPVMGKGPEAVEHFTTLIQQQEASGMSDPKYAQTYLVLGNLYQTQGKADEAKKTWAKGATAFPNNAELQKKAR